MEGAVIGFILGVFVGAMCGIVTTAILAAGRDDDDEWRDD